MGDGPFIAAYKHLQAISNNEIEDEDDVLTSVLKEKGMAFLPLIHQLICCEDAYYLSKEPA